MLQVILGWDTSPHIQVRLVRKLQRPLDRLEAPLIAQRVECLEGFQVHEV